MSAALAKTNAAWLLELRDSGPNGVRAQRELRELVLRALRRGLERRPVAGALLEDFAQESVLRILSQLDSFRDESRFSTWAIAIAMRVSFSALRRHHWRDVSLDALFAGTATHAPDATGATTSTASTGATAVPDAFASKALTPERELARRQIVAALERCVAESLTERQQKVVLAELRGMPQEEIAAQLGMSRNAVYKLCHDARRALQRSLEQAGHAADSVRWAFE
jgi:RNA polymerase sigma-70 factor, ECF subfamily